MYTGTCPNRPRGNPQERQIHIRTFIAEFKVFINRGNLLTLAVVFVIGAAERSTSYRSHSLSFG